VVSLLVALGIGFINGYLVCGPGSGFLITLSPFFALRGITWASPRRSPARSPLETSTNWTGRSAKAVFAANINLGFITSTSPCCGGILFVAIGTWVLLRIPGRNWIFASGGNPRARARVGVP